ncbi:hypothetical protein BSR29_03720 [Boudabousia liubingyangii]|uniref:DUF3040 domain-containing protein n=1 Tax=Boudabousia liubingyangii TaxID=1921764 RepID=A0A1Q5PND5_9ACTO|nr:DUF3040 domain-containing protein [Boudabousia liubingyangii]OKL47536.1 hypothetical protein BSR28_03290 [Boudabousia liubingyangii]OKL48960.1 hypothetical protein BSR29_03720 [Boudabousia liubingyangii]
MQSIVKAPEAHVNLSDREREVLEQLEESLKSDPDFASSVAQFDTAVPSAHAPEVKPPKASWNLHRIALGGGIVLVGLVALLVGVTWGYNLPGVIIAVLGVLAMIGGMYLVLTPGVNGKEKTKSPKSSTSNPSSFKARQQERFQRRNERP